MSTLSDKDIIKEMDNGLIITPFDQKIQLQPASVDLTLGDKFKVGIKPNNDEYIDTRYPMNMVDTRASAMIVPAGEFLLGHTKELIKIPKHMLGRVEGRSSIGRCGLLIHATAGFIDPGFEGNITLELFNLTHHPIQIYKGQRICQIALEYLSSECERGYGEKYDSKYHGQLGVVSSKINEDK